MNYNHKFLDELYEQTIKEHEGDRELLSLISLKLSVGPNGEPDIPPHIARVCAVVDDAIDKKTKVIASLEENLARLPLYPKPA